MDTSRRTVLAGFGGLVAGSVVANMAGTTSLVHAADNTKMPRFAQPGGDFTWTPHKLDPDECARVAYEGYYYKGYGCGYGAFYAIIGLLAEKYGAPYNTFPFYMLTTNKSGISGWATICGALYGAAAAFGIFWNTKQRGPLVDELFKWYEDVPLPIYNPQADFIGVKGDVPQTVAHSVLCHVSASKWAQETGNPVNSKIRSERCGRITADVAKQACIIYNRKIDEGDNFKSAFARNAEDAKCMTCHGKGKEYDWAKGKMTCQPCHGGSDSVQNKFVDHP